MERKAKGILALGLAAVLLLIPGGVLFDGWLNAPGIHFYERGVAKPAENVKVSVVVPVYNAEKYLEPCLDSLRKQTLKEIEIICVNDGSTDKSGEILAEYAAHDKRIKVITQENQYIGAARNRGIEAATGEYIGFVDNDDLVSPDYFEDLYNAAKKYNTDVAIAGEVYTLSPRRPWWYEDGRPLRERLFNRQDRYDLSVWRKPLGAFLAEKDVVEMIDVAEKSIIKVIWDKIYRRDFLNAHNIRFPTERALGEDSYFFYAVGKKCGRAAVAENAAYYLRRGVVTTSSMHYDKPLIAKVRVYKKTANLFEPGSGAQEADSRWREDLHNHLWHIFELDYNKYLLADKELWRQWWRQSFPELGIDEKLQQKTADALIAEGK